MAQATAGSSPFHLARAGRIERHVPNMFLLHSGDGATLLHMAGFYEFFAGGGMARAGLGAGWACSFANDIDPMKARTYAANWGDDHLTCGDVGHLAPSDLPDRADLAWASFPCQDLSLAGRYEGLGNADVSVRTRSGTFWSFWALMQALREQDRAPRLIVLENVVGTLTSRGGRDFAAICEALGNADYRFGAIVCDARLFVPQSRPRVFFVAAAPDVRFSPALLGSRPDPIWHPNNLTKAVDGLPIAVRERWRWWNPPTPPPRMRSLADVLENSPTGVRWHGAAATDRLVEAMTPLHRAKLEDAQSSGSPQVGAVYKRTRTLDGVRRVRAEVRFDGLAGCLRTPSGGSSRQTIIIVDGQRLRSRLLSAREAARLMGLPDDYRLPPRYNDAYHVAGDGVCVPVVRFITEHLLEPMLPVDSMPFTLAA